MSDFTKCILPLSYIKDLKRNGYCVIKNYLSVEKCKEIRLIIDNFIEMYPKNIWVDENKSDHRIMGAENISKVIESLDLNLFTKEIGSQYLSQELELFMIMANKTIFKNDISISNDGRYLAYSFVTNESKSKNIEILDLTNKELLNDKIESINFGKISWKGNGFYYTKFLA